MATLNCYISFSVGTSTAGLRQALSALNVRVSSLEDLSPAGLNFVSVIEKQIKDADFLCVVLDRKAQNANPLFELGLAVGLNKPVFIVAENRNDAPAALSSFPIVQSTADNEEVLKFHLNMFLQNLKRSKQARAPVILNRLRRRRTEPRSEVKSPKTAASSAQEFEDLILTSLKSKGVGTVGGPEFKTLDELGRPDAVAWFSDAPPDFGSPLIIEAKRTQSRATIRAAVEQLAQYLQRSQLRTGLVVFEGAGSDIDIYPAPTGYVFAISINEFLRRVNDGNLIKRLVARRNRFAHTGL